MSYVITADNVDRIKATVICEAANVATLPEAEAALLARGVDGRPRLRRQRRHQRLVVVGRHSPTSSRLLMASFRKISGVLRPLTHRAARRARREGITPREAATAISEEKRAAVAEHYPTSVKSAAVAR